MAWFSRKKSMTLDDPVFGHIVLESGLWTSTPPDSTQPYMITIDASDRGPSEIQRHFYLRLQSSPAGMMNESRAFIAQNTATNTSRLEICAIYVGTDHECELGQFDIELSDDTADEIHVVSFENHVPSRYPATINTKTKAQK
jgi:hypothetical protein